MDSLLKATLPEVYWVLLGLVKGPEELSEPGEALPVGTTEALEVIGAIVDPHGNAIVVVTVLLAEDTTILVVKTVEVMH